MSSSLFDYFRITHQEVKDLTVRGISYESLTLMKSKNRAMAEDSNPASPNSTRHHFEYEGNLF